MKSLWSEGELTLPTIEATAMKNAEAIAQCQALTDVAELTFESLEAFYGK